MDLKKLKTMGAVSIASLGILMGYGKPKSENKNYKIPKPEKKVNDGSELRARIESMATNGLGYNSFECTTAQIKMSNSSQEELDLHFAEMEVKTHPKNTELKGLYDSLKKSYADRNAAQIAAQNLIAEANVNTEYVEWRFNRLLREEQNGVVTPKPFSIGPLVRGPFDEKYDTNILEYIINKSSNFNTDKEIKKYNLNLNKILYVSDLKENSNLTPIIIREDINKIIDSDKNPDKIINCGKTNPINDYLCNRPSLSEEIQKNYSKLKKPENNGAA
jgi:hypothetical protein